VSGPRWERPIVALIGVALVFLAYAALRSWRSARGRDAPADVPAVSVSANGHAGSNACRGCHASEHAAWADSVHARGSRLIGEAERAALTSLEGVSSVGGVLTLQVPVTVDPDGVGELRAVIGATPLWQPLVALSGGREQPLDRAWDVEREEWFTVTNAPAGTWTHWAGRGSNWNSQCAPCHDTGVSIGWKQGDTYDTTLAERGVGCEACHGAAAAHARTPAVPVPVATPGIDTCLACHSRRSPLTGVAAPGAPFLSAFAPASVGDPELYWPDGQVRAEVFEGSFLASRMHEAGVRCADCHTGHAAQLRRTGDALCLGCHASQPGFEAHDQHEGAVACTDCHMPTTMFMVRQPRHDHGFTVPDPGLGVEAGVPDACTRCHTDEDARWAATVVAEWYGAEPRPSAVRSRAFARDHASALLTVATADPHPAWRAAATRRLAPYVDEPGVLPHLARARLDPEPLVRLGAYDALGDARRADLAAPGVDDTVRAVRVAAGRAAASLLDPASPASADLRDWLDANADQPGPAVERARWLLARGALKEAWPWLAQAARWDPEDPETRLLFAFTALRLGRRYEAGPALEAATRLAPHLPDVWLALAMLRREEGDLSGALDALQRGERAAPDRRLTAEKGRVIAALREAASLER
jgi:predicted CXXCH cytochrome family protein